MKCMECFITPLPTTNKSQYVWVSCGETVLLCVSAAPSLHRILVAHFHAGCRSPVGVLSLCHWLAVCSCHRLYSARKSFILLFIFWLLLCCPAHTTKTSLSDCSQVHVHSSRRMTDSAVNFINCFFFT